MTDKTCDTGAKIHTYFAPAERTDEKTLRAEIEIINNNPVVQGLLHSVSGLLAVLDEHRQVVALNDTLLQMLDIKDPGDALGLRPGEALHCIHSREEPGGCGTSRYCASCGAVVAIVACLASDNPIDRICTLTTRRGERTLDFTLMVRAQPLKIEGRRFLLLFLQDITLQQQRAVLERAFFHDISNMLSGLLGASQFLLLKNKDVSTPDSKLIETIYQAALRLSKEVSIQKSLFQNQAGDYQISRQEVTVGQIMGEVDNVFAGHPVASGKRLELSSALSDLVLKTDLSLVVRILCNMVINALEASERADTVKVWPERKDDCLVFSVRNRQEIPEHVALRIFQRNFSTKGEQGRGTGTYLMKLFGENVLGGKVDFHTSREDGTTFSFSLPL